jgi:alpha-galactosidase
MGTILRTCSAIQGGLLNFLNWIPIADGFSMARNQIGMKTKLSAVAAFGFVFGLVLLGRSANASTIRLDELNIRNTEQDWGEPHSDRSVEGHNLSIGGKLFEHGVGTHANSTLSINVNGATQFSASVGVDGEVTSREASVEFSVAGDGKVLWKSGVVRAGQAAKTFSVDLRGIKKLLLEVGDADDGINYDHADWADAVFQYDGEPPATIATPKEQAVILTPPEPLQPRINGALVVGARPGHPFFYHVPVTGQAPVTLSAENLPSGLSFDAAKGEITGTSGQAGEYQVTLRAENARGHAEKILKIVIGDTIALTPPLGWNSWNCFANAVDDAKIRAAADAMVSSGLISHGWTYINIDDCWEGARDANGFIQSNEKFPDMKALADYVHSKGLKMGIWEYIRHPGRKHAPGSRRVGSTKRKMLNNMPHGASTISNMTGALTPTCRTNRYLSAND